MFSKKKEATRQPRSGNLAQYGLFEIPDNLDDLTMAADDDNDEDLEAELAALTSGGNANNKPKRKVQKIDPNELSTMIAESMKDVDEDVSDGEDDPELLEELNIITGDEPALSDEEAEEEVNKSEDSPVNENNSSVSDTVKILQERLILYQKAEKKAKQQNEAGKARRYGRGVKTLQNLLKDAQAGNAINTDDIPPPLPASATSEPTEQPAEETVPTEVPEEPEAPEAPEATETNRLPSPEQEQAPEVEPAAESAIQVDEEALASLKQRQQEYKIAALAWKKAGNMQEAMQHVKMAKQFDIVIAAVNRGEPIDLSDMPPTPSGPSVTAVSPTSPPSTEKEEAETQQHAEPNVPASSEATETRHGLEDVGSALKERLEVYKRTKAAAESEGNSSKARRYGRICKQFEDAIKLHARGKPVPLDELPTPPGYPPLSAPVQSDVPTSSGTTEEEKPAPMPSPPENKTAETAGGGAPSPPPRKNANKNQKQTSRAEKQTVQLQQRQRELKQAALNAKKDGDLEMARDYLRQAKRMDPLIEASKAGLPVEMNSIPLSPIAKMELNAHDLTGATDDSFQFVSSEDCTEESGGTDEHIYENLENQLTKQIKWCLTTRNHCKQNGDVPGYNKWERLALGYTLDLDALRVRKRDGLPPPVHHYETKTYSIVQSCVDLNDSDVEVSIMRGVNYAREADTYVMFDFPYPTDNPSSDRTSTIKGTCNPEYDAVFLLAGILDRNSRQCQRAFKRHALKCQVWAKGCSLNPILCCTHPRGFFRSDSLLGTVTVKLQPLEMQCTLHDSFPLMDGRKPAGGKLELKIRLRNPILTKQIEKITDRWLIIDS